MNKHRPGPSGGGAAWPPAAPARRGSRAESGRVRAGGLQGSGSKFQSSDSSSRELELTNLLGLVLGCIEAKFCK